MKIVQGLIIDATVCLPVEGLFFPIGEMCVSLCVCVRMQASAPACVCVCTCLWPDWIVEICVRCLSAAADTQVADPSTLCHHWYSPQRSGRAVTQPKRGRGATDLWWEPEAWRRKGTDRESKRKKKRERQRERKRKAERKRETEAGRKREGELERGSGVRQVCVCSSIGKAAQSAVCCTVPTHRRRPCLLW